MGSLIETLLFILPWILLGTSLILYGYKNKQYSEACINLNEALLKYMEYRNLYREAKKEAEEYIKRYGKI